MDVPPSGAAAAARGEGGPAREQVSALELVRFDTFSPSKHDILISTVVYPVDFNGNGGKRTFAPPFDLANGRFFSFGLSQPCIRLRSLIPTRIIVGIGRTKT